MMKGLCTYIHPGWNTSFTQWWKGSSLTSIQDRTHPTHNDGRVSYSHPGGNTSSSQWWKISTLSSRPEPHPAHNDGISLFFHAGRNHILLTMIKDSHPRWNTYCSQWWNIYAFTFIQVGTHPSHSDEKTLDLHPSRWENILLTVMEGLCTYIHPGGNTSCLQWWKRSALTSI